MPIIGGREIEIGLGIETTPGTGVTPTIYPKWLDFSLQSMAEKSPFRAARGIRNEASGSVIKRKFAQGSLKVVPDVEIAPYLFGLALGSVSTALAETAISTGTATTDTLNKLIDTGATFVTDGVGVGDAVHNTADDTWGLVTAVDSETSLSLDSDVFPDGNETYEVGTPAYKHTISVQNANASMKTATLVAKESSIVTEQYVNSVIDSLTLEASDDFAEMTAELYAKFGASGSLTPSYTEETYFAYKDLTAKFGTTIANAIAASATALKSVSLQFQNNVQVDEAFLSGSNEPAAGGFVAGTQIVSGTYVLHFKDTTELDKYKANTKNAMVIDLLGASIGDAENERIRIQIASLMLTKAPREYNLDGVIVLSQDFTAEYSATETKTADVEVTNENNGENY
jgi:hypothetical protein